MCGFPSYLWSVESCAQMLLSVVTVQELPSIFCKMRINVPSFRRFLLGILFITLVCEHFAVQGPVFVISLVKIIPIKNNYIIILITWPVKCIISAVLTSFNLTERNLSFCTVIKRRRSNVSNVSGRTDSNGFCVSQHEHLQARHWHLFGHCSRTVNDTGLSSCRDLDIVSYS
jgi:hypothetical protein